MHSSSSYQSASNPTLKRTRSSEHVQLPQLEPDTYLRVYTHKSLRRPCATSPDEYEDNERLSVLGEKALDAAVMTALFYERPLLGLSEMEAKKKEITSWMNIDSWVRRYQMREKVRCHPDQFEMLHSPEETNALFYAYVGGVFANLGMDAVQEWINALMGLSGIQQPPPSQRRVKNLPTPQLQPAQPTPPRPQFIPPNPFAQFSRFPSTPMPMFPATPMVKPPPPPPKLPNPMTPAQPHLAFLPQFNEKASQRRVVVEYPAQFSGPPHAGKWTVKCVVNGIEKGQGVGGNKQIAKEQAARAAYYAMGWT
ncbi:uncharacterized protein EV420DRAFT_1512273 [Desarmillaria tabescens]|uniref:DRBM domain-containing protein n=1 Tax=Armillaria tabescens TaxID=1929756 RepID=A0AA39NG27_ARMTA|nr:uncharacterized protein EV420DRAFT_1512273 [Desarmillaria tabescens]KAK0464992.1 hypothetical protein EV420DRAFT_1512273 [Desarmillaria tabescens]